MRGGASYKRFLGLGVAFLLLAGRSQLPSSPPAPLPSGRGRITQVSVINALMIGR